MSRKYDKYESMQVIQKIRTCTAKVSNAQMREFKSI